MLLANTRTESLEAAKAASKAIENIESAVLLAGRGENRELVHRLAQVRVQAQYAFEASQELARVAQQACSQLSPQEPGASSGRGSTAASPAGAFASLGRVLSKVRDTFSASSGHADEIGPRPARRPRPRERSPPPVASDPAPDAVTAPSLAMVLAPRERKQVVQPVGALHGDTQASALKQQPLIIPPWAESNAAAAAAAEATVALAIKAGAMIGQEPHCAPPPQELPSAPAQTGRKRARSPAPKRITKPRMDIVKQER